MHLARLSATVSVRLCSNTFPALAVTSVQTPVPSGYSLLLQIEHHPVDLLRGGHVGAMQKTVGCREKVFFTEKTAKQTSGHTRSTPLPSCTPMLSHHRRENCTQHTFPTGPNLHGLLVTVGVLLKEIQKQKGPKQPTPTPRGHRLTTAIKMLFKLGMRASEQELSPLQQGLQMTVHHRAMVVSFVFFFKFLQLEDSVAEISHPLLLLPECPQKWGLAKPKIRS